MTEPEHDPTGTVWDSDPDGLLDDLEEAQDSAPMPEELEAASEALSALMCPWYRQVGICRSGCHEEPSCQTDEPTQGWVSQLLVSAAELFAQRAREKGGWPEAEPAVEVEVIEWKDPVLPLPQGEDLQAYVDAMGETIRGLVARSRIPTIFVERPERLDVAGYEPLALYSIDAHGNVTRCPCWTGGPAMAGRPCYVHGIGTGQEETPWATYRQRYVLGIEQDPATIGQSPGQLHTAAARDAHEAHLEVQVQQLSPEEYARVQAELDRPAEVVQGILDLAEQVHQVGLHGTFPTPVPEPETLPPPGMTLAEALCSDCLHGGLKDCADRPRCWAPLDRPAAHAAVESHRAWCQHQVSDAKGRVVWTGHLHEVSDPVCPYSGPFLSDPSGTV